MWKNSCSSLVVLGSWCDKKNNKGNPRTFSKLPQKVLRQRPHTSEVAFAYVCPCLLVGACLVCYARRKVMGEKNTILSSKPLISIIIIIIIYTY